ncbi:MAG TPA: IPT/TIG domain-containing protein [Saprospiraceae bacterium]|nr:IPT/TIG domain-containing protein [Saprospiraceae bacterium]
MKKLISFNVLLQQIYSIKSIMFYCMIAMNVFSTSLSGQCMMVPISLEQQMTNSDIVVEGEVISKSGFETQAGDFIYTSYQLSVTKIFKGNLNSYLVEIVEPGGTVGSRSIKVEPGYALQVGESGTFFLSLFSFRDERDRMRFTAPVYRAHGSTQSVFRYDFYDDRVSGFFMQFAFNEWYDALKTQTGKTYNEIKSLKKPVKSTLRMVPSITSITPLTITGGTYSQLTINGSGFGTVIGGSSVQFKYADDGGATWMTPSNYHVQSWSNTQIKIWVPYKAGTGQVRVVVDGNTATSSQTLSVTYSESNLEWDDGPNHYLIQTQHGNDNGSGGYTFQYHTEFNSNAAARKSYERALNSWRCATEVNWTIGATSTIDVIAEDGVNIVRFDNGTELAEGVGAAMYSFYDDCFAPALNCIHVPELDMVINDAFPGGVTWEYGPDLPSATEIDFETVIVHELGHALQLGHVINTGQVLHYSVSPGNYLRILQPNDQAGGAHVHVRSTTNQTYCDISAMLDYRQIKYVDQAASGIESGDSWTHAFKKLQDALLNVTSCVDTIYVAKGTYYPDEGVGLTNNDQALRFLLNSPIVLIGGYPNSGGTRNLVANQTILSGDIEQDGLTDAQNSQNVVKMTSNSAVVDGFVIERGYADAASGEGKDGGGLYNQSNGVVRNTIFRNNKAVGTVSNGDGGAVFSASGFPSFQNLLVYGNEATRNGSAFWVGQNPALLVNCTITKNLVGNGAVYISSIGSGGAYLPNNIFWNNGIDLILGSALGWADVSNSMFDDASLPGGAYGDSYLLNTNPQFVNPGADNYAIVLCSPATNTGVNGNNSTTIDVLGNPRFVGTIDRGAFENTSIPPPTVVTSTGNSGPGTLRTIIADCCSGNTITFAPSLINQTITLTGGNIEINKHLNIYGPGMDQLNISGNGTSHIFTVLSSKDFFLKDLSLIEGDAAISSGNCIQNSGNLTLQNVRLARQLSAASPITLYNSGNVIFQNQVIVK